MARRCGLDNINTDLIAGLPGDDYEGFTQTLEGILRLDPESVTVHTLSMKRASNLVIHRRADYRVKDDAVRMVGLTADRLPRRDTGPIISIGRAVRWAIRRTSAGQARPGGPVQRLYHGRNPHHPGCGAGAVTKLKQFGTEYLERIFNYKFPYEYIDRFEEMLRRKEGIAAFYEQYMPSIR